MKGKISVTKCMTTETAHRLCNYSGKCANIHGHSYRWEVTAALTNNSISEYNQISVDFAELKEAMRNIIYKRFDHALVLWKEDPLYGSSADAEMRFTSDGGDQKIVWLDRNPTAEVFAEDAASALQSYFSRAELGVSAVINEDEAQSTQVDILRVRVWETADSYGQWLLEGRSN